MKKRFLALILIVAMTLAIAIPAMANDPGNANKNSRTDGYANVLDYVTDAAVWVNGNGNTLRVNATIGTVYAPGLVAQYVGADRPVNDRIYTVKLAGFEIDVYIKGNKIDGGILGIWDLNCYRECFDCGDYCTPTRDNPCACACTCGGGFDSNCATITCDPCSGSNPGSNNNHSNCHGFHHVHGKIWATKCACCGPLWTPCKSPTCEYCDENGFVEVLCQVCFLDEVDCTCE